MVGMLRRNDEDCSGISEARQVVDVRALAVLVVDSAVASDFGRSDQNQRTVEAIEQRFAAIGKRIHDGVTLAHGSAVVGREVLRRACWWMALLVVVMCVMGCRNRPRPWEQTGEDAAPPWPTASGPQPLLSPTFAQVAPALPPGASGGQLLVDDAPVPLPVRVGGPWVRCYGDFRLTGPLMADLTRLTMLCGPANGMKRHSKQAVEGEVQEGGAPLTTALSAKKGFCYRVFAVADPSVPDLDVIVRSSRGAPIAQDHGEDRWPIVQPDRPFCPLEDDALTIEIVARHGKGRAAAEVWMLRAAMPD